MSSKKQASQEHEALVLVSPGGHRYEITVSDSGNLNVKYAGKVNDDGSDS